jgi:hypothetical protein
MISRPTGAIAIALLASGYDLRFSSFALGLLPRGSRTARLAEPPPDSIREEFAALRARHELKAVGADGTDGVEDESAG